MPKEEKEINKLQELIDIHGGVDERLNSLDSFEERATGTTHKEKGYLESADPEIYNPKTGEVEMGVNHRPYGSGENNEDVLDGNGDLKERLVIDSPDAADKVVQFGKKVVDGMKKIPGGIKDFVVRDDVVEMKNKLKAGEITQEDYDKWKQDLVSHQKNEETRKMGEIKKEAARVLNKDPGEIDSWDMAKAMEVSGANDKMIQANQKMAGKIAKKGIDGVSEYNPVTMMMKGQRAIAEKMTGEKNEYMRDVQEKVARGQKVLLEDFTRPFFGVDADVVPDEERELTDKVLGFIGSAAGYAGQFMTIRGATRKAGMGLSAKPNKYATTNKLGQKVEKFSRKFDRKSQAPPKYVPKKSTFDFAGAKTKLKQWGDAFAKKGKGPIRNNIRKFMTQKEYRYEIFDNIATDILAGQLDPELGDDIGRRFKVAASDTVLGGFLDGLSSTNKAFGMPASFSLGYGMAKLSGASNEDALVEGMGFGVLVGATSTDRKKDIPTAYANEKLQKEAKKALNNPKAKKETKEYAKQILGKKRAFEIAGSVKEKKSAIVDIVRGEREGGKFTGDPEAAKKIQRISTEDSKQFRREVLENTPDEMKKDVETLLGKDPLYNIKKAEMLEKEAKPEGKTDLKTDDQITQVADTQNQQKLSLKEKVKKTGQDFREAFNDNFSKLLDEMKKGGGEVPFREKMAQVYGAGSTTSYYHEYGIKPIFKNLMDNVSVKKDTAYNAWRDFNISQLEIVRGKDGVKGYSAKAGKKKLQELKQELGKKDYNTIKDTAKKTTKFMKKAFKKNIVDKGLMKEAEYERMVGKYDYYIPFNRVFDTLEDRMGREFGQDALSVRGENVKKGKFIEGSETKRAIQDPVEAMMTQIHQMVLEGKRNEVAKEIINIGKRMPGWERVDARTKTGTISAMLDGKRETYKAPQEVVDAAMNLTSGEAKFLSKWEHSDQAFKRLAGKALRSPAKAVRWTATGGNPFFVLTNLPSDIITAFRNTGVNPLNVGKAVLSVMKKGDLYKDFLKNGGKMSMLNIDQSVLSDSARTISGRGVSITKPITLLRKVKEAAETMGEWGEQATRLAVYDKKKKEALAKNKTDKEASLEAAWWSQEATTNFARKGFLMDLGNQLIPFLNASWQGKLTDYRFARENPAAWSLRLALSVQIPAVALAAWNSQFEEFFDEDFIPEYDRAGNFIIMAPWTQDGYFAIPKRGIGKIANPTEALVLYAMGKEGPDFGNSLSQTIVDVSSPIDFDVDDAGKTLLGGLIPAGVKPIGENILNYDFWRDRELVYGYDENVASYLQYDKNTPDIYVKAAKSLFDISGGTLDISPTSLENVAGDTLTSYEDMGAQAIDAAMRKVSDGGELEPANKKKANTNPILKRFWKERRYSKEQVRKFKSWRDRDLKKTEEKYYRMYYDGQIDRGEMEKRLEDLYKDFEKD